MNTGCPENEGRNKESSTRNNGQFAFEYIFHYSDKADHSKKSKELIKNHINIVSAAAEQIHHGYEFDHVHVAQVVPERITDGKKW